MVEALVALLLGLFVICLSLTVLARQRGAVASLARTSDALAAVRVARELLGEEARNGDRRRDGWAVSSDSLALRAFRGEAYVCGPGPTPDELVVEAKGVRVPEPAKDSVMLLGDAGKWTAWALDDVATATACSGDSTANPELWRLSGEPPPGALLARYFERGSYHVADRALRYRRGMGGRQPLTPAVVKTPDSGFGGSGGSTLLLLEIEGSPIPWRISVSADESDSGA